MKTVFDFLGKLVEINWISAENKSIKGELNGNTIEFCLKTELAKNYHDISLLPIQVVAYVKINGHQAGFWGSDSNEDNSALVKFFAENEVIARRNEYKIEKNNRDISNKIWDNLK